MFFASFYFGGAFLRLFFAVTAPATAKLKLSADEVIYTPPDHSRVGSVSGSPSSFLKSDEYTPPDPRGSSTSSSFLKRFGVVRDRTNSARVVNARGVCCNRYMVNVGGSFFKGWFH